jgi:hypothetical protein
MANDDAGFKAWMTKVDAIVWRKAGCSVDDLADVCYRDWYEDEVPPARAASMALRGGE